MLEAMQTTMHDVRSTNNDDNTGYCDNLSTMTTMQTTACRSTNNDDTTGYCNILSTLTAMQRTMLEATPTMTTLATETTSADNDVRSASTMLATATTTAQ